MVWCQAKLEPEDMAQDPLVIQEPIPSTHDRRPSKGMEASQRSLQSADDLCNGTIWWWLSDDVGMHLLRLQAGPYNHTYDT